MANIDQDHLNDTVRALSNAGNLFFVSLDQEFYLPALNALGMLPTTSKLLFP